VDVASAHSKACRLPAVPQHPQPLHADKRKPDVIDEDSNGSPGCDGRGNVPRSFDEMSRLRSGPHRPSPLALRCEVKCRSSSCNYSAESSRRRGKGRWRKSGLVGRGLCCCVDVDQHRLDETNVPTADPFGSHNDQRSYGSKVLPGMVHPLTLDRTGRGSTAPKRGPPYVVPLLLLRRKPWLSTTI
jgi:hypothetical protein